MVVRLGSVRGHGVAPVEPRGTISASKAPRGKYSNQSAGRVVERNLLDRLIRVAYILLAVQLLMTEIMILSDCFS